MPGPYEETGRASSRSRNLLRNAGLLTYQNQLTTAGLLLACGEERRAAQKVLRKLGDPPGILENGSNATLTDPPLFRHLKVLWPHVRPEMIYVYFRRLRSWYVAAGVEVRVMLAEG